MMPGEATDRFAETMENLTKTARMSCPPTADTSCRVKFDPHIRILFWLPWPQGFACAGWAARIAGRRSDPVIPYRKPPPQVDLKRSVPVGRREQADVGDAGVLAHQAGLLGQLPGPPTPR